MQTKTRQSPIILTGEAGWQESRGALVHYEALTPNTPMDPDFYTTPSKDLLELFNSPGIHSLSEKTGNGRKKTISKIKLLKGIYDSK